jgi:gentisate 1,2-dioxygenase
MQAFTVTDLLQQQAVNESPYLEFLRVPSLSMGLYVLPTGAVDQQQPHTEDEVYYVVRGRGRFTHVEHRFHTITEDLHILVCFAPAEYVNRK